MYGVFFGMFLHIRKSLCHAACCDKPFLPRKGQAIPADVDTGGTTRILTLTTMIVVGEAIGNREGLSRLYAHEFKHLYRK